LNNKIGYIICFLIVVSSCKKDILVIDDNNPPVYSAIPTVLIENYINRIYIDLIGREPLDSEMLIDVQYLRDNDVSIESRDSLIYKLQFDTLYIEGDESYKLAYFHRIYDMVKVRLIEGASNGDISFYMSNHYADYEVDSVAGNLIEAQKHLLKYYSLSAIIDSELDYYNNIIDIKEMHKRMIYNSIYDQINMNTFNFVNAAFDNLLFRYPTQNEFNNSYFMIEDNQPFTIFGYSGSNKLDFTNLICDSREFYEGIIQWTYLTMLARIPTSIERDFLMNDFYITTDFQKLQRFIMTTDEYAHF
jgi:hypothetical protein|tara:strand:- start:1448 stop:2356 length:909 start_codon:yes stop_codon:yes gene_type:complete